MSSPPMPEVAPSRPASGSATGQERANRARQAAFLKIADAQDTANHDATECDKAAQGQRTDAGEALADRAAQRGDAADAHQYAAGQMRHDVACTGKGFDTEA